MKWGRKKPLASSFSSSQPSSMISHLFSVSWLSKFKHKSFDNSEPRPGKLKPQGKWNSSSVSSRKRVSERFKCDGKFYGSDDDGAAFWRLLFEQDNTEEKTKRVCQKSSDLYQTSPELRTIQEQREDLSLEQKRREMSEEETRRSLYERKRTKQRKSYSKVRAETCKVIAFRGMRKKKNGAKTSLDRFAVVKSSFDPRKDFRESIVEMILVKNMRQSDELEELLACYLTLNSDDHHDLIIKVFKEVWFALDQFGLVTDFVFS